MNRKQHITNALRPFAPSGTAEILAQRIIEHRCQLTITRARKTKAGDYRHPWGDNGHRISINGSLNEFAFLITFVHEVAHLKNWERHRNTVKPHGNEWKAAFQEEMRPFLNNQVFPDHLLAVLIRHMQNPKSATIRDQKLVRALRKYDKPNEYVLLDEIPLGAQFKLGKRIFEKGEKLRTRYRCEEQGTAKTYLISGIAEVKLT